MEGESPKEEDLPASEERCSLVHLSAREILIVTTCARLWKKTMGATETCGEDNLNALSLSGE